MSDRVDVIIEFNKPQRHAFEKYAKTVASPDDRHSAADNLMAMVTGYGCELHEESIPIPMVTGPAEPKKSGLHRLSKFAAQGLSPDISSTTVTMEVSIPKKNIARLQKKSGIIVWPSSPMTFFAAPKPIFPQPDCQHKSIATIEELRELLRIDALWAAKLDGSGIVVAVVDEGIDGSTYPIAGGYDAPASQVPGAALLDSHGSMCAADILVCAPKVKLLDYPMLAPSSGSGLRMYQHILNLKRTTGTPHLANNSYGYVGVPPKSKHPNHEVHDVNHPFHRKVREVIAAGVTCFFCGGKLWRKLSVR